MPICVCARVVGKLMVLGPHSSSLALDKVVYQSPPPQFPCLDHNSSHVLGISVGMHVLEGLEFSLILGNLWDLLVTHVKTARLARSSRAMGAHLSRKFRLPRRKAMIIR
jgi:hypothetical protein